MKRQVATRKIAVLALGVVLTVVGITGIGYGNTGSSYPHFHDNSTTRSVAENVATNTNVGSAVSAHDRGTYGRYVLGGTDASSFSIDSGSGQLKTNTTLDYETKTSYTVTVTVQRGTINPLSDAITGPIIEYTDSDSITVAINVTNVTLTFTDGDSTTRSVAEDTASNTNIGSAVSASNFNSNLDRYELSGTDSSSFSITSSSGQLKTKASLDHETKHSYSVTVKVYAGAQTGAEDSISVTIRVTDGPDTSCPDNYVLQNGRCLYDAYCCGSGPGFGEADPLPSISSEEAARIADALAMDKIIFNELRNASTDSHDWVELRNVSDAAVDLSDWQLLVVTGETALGVSFPVGTVLPAGELLLLANTDLHAPDMPLASPEGALYHYLVNEGLILPQGDFTLLLRSPVSWEDAAGNYFFGYPTPPTAPPFTTDAAWYRARPGVPGHRSEAWVESGYQGGFGYDAGVPDAIALGSPGYSHSSLTGDVNGDGIVNILDLVAVASRFGESGASDVDVNSDGIINVQDLVLVSNAFGSVIDAPSAN